MSERDNDGQYYQRRTGRVRRPREYNRIIDMDRFRILDRLTQRKGSWTLDSLHKYVSEANGLRPKEWDFYYIISQMEQDALLLAKYDPEWKATMVKATDYGRQQFERLKDQLRAILAK